MSKEAAIMQINRRVAQIRRGGGSAHQLNMTKVGKGTYFVELPSAGETDESSGQGAKGKEEQLAGAEAG